MLRPENIQVFGYLGIRAFGYSVTWGQLAVTRGQLVKNLGTFIKTPIKKSPGTPGTVINKMSNYY